MTTLVSEDSIKQIVKDWFNGRKTINEAEAVRLCVFMADKARGQIVADILDGQVRRPQPDISPSINEIQGRTTKH